MRKIKRSIALFTIVLTVLLGGIVSVSAAWSSQINVELPPWGVGVFVEKGVVKESNSGSFSVEGRKESNFLDPHAILVNSNKEYRSGWCKIRQGEVNTLNNNTGLKNYIYYTIAASNSLEPNSTLVSYAFNPY